jgi:nitrogen fixation NifU-like protein
MLFKNVRFYHKNVLEHFYNPRNIGNLDNTKKNVGTALVGKASCGDVIKLQIEIDKHNKIVDAKFKTFGCGSAIASSSYLTEIIKNKHIDDISKITNYDIAKYLNLPPVKIHCSVLAEEALKLSIDNLKKKNK